MNKVNAQKLLNSKWTAQTPQNKEKHFIVTNIEFDEHGEVSSCELEAVFSKRQRYIDWRELKDTGRWKQGWLN